MTLVKGNHLVKLDQQGEPLTTDLETYIEYEVSELTPIFSAKLAATEDQGTYDSFVVALLRKVR